MTSSITLILSSEEIETLHQYYQNYLLSAVPYSIFRAKVNDTTITAYTSGKVLFQGKNAQEQAKQWDSLTTMKEKHPTTVPQTNRLPNDFANWTIIGSDEVGNGSYFGALTVCAVYLAKEQQALMKELGVKDSKALSDKQIIELAGHIKACVPYHLTICSPLKYNQANKTRNANAIKVSLHNFTLQKLLHKLNDEQKTQLQGVLIDQFTPAKNYYNYLKKEEHPYEGKIYFEQKGESHHLAVACASIIARAAFLESLETLGKPFNMILPSGAGSNVDHIGIKLVQKYGVNCLQQIAKLHFANTKKIMNHTKET